MNVYIRNIHIYIYISVYNDIEKTLVFSCSAWIFRCGKFSMGDILYRGMSSWRRHEKKLFVGRVQPGVSKLPPPKILKKLHNFEPRKTGKHRQMFFCPILVMFFFFFLRDALAYIFYELLKQEEGGIGEYNRANRSLGHFVENAAGQKVGTCCANARTKNDETIWKHEWMTPKHDFRNHGEWSAVRKSPSFSNSEGFIAARIYPLRPLCWLHFPLPDLHIDGPGKPSGVGMFELVLGCMKPVFFWACWVHLCIHWVVLRIGKMVGENSFGWHP